MIPAVIALLLPAALGYLIIALLFRGDSDCTLAERLGLSFPVGAGVLALQMFVLGVLRVPLTLAGMTVPLLLEIAGLFFWGRRKGALAAPQPSFPLLREILGRKTFWLRSMALTALLLWAVCQIGSVFYETLLRPIFAWDSWVNWAAGAKHLYASHSLLLDAPPADWFGKSTGRYYQYPPLNTLLEIWIALWTGSFDETLVKLWSPAMLLSLSLSLYLFAARRTGRLTGLALVVMVVSSPFVALHGIEVYSDLAQAVFGFSAVTALFEAMNGRRPFWALAGLFLALAMFTKEEGLFFAAPFVLSALAFLFLRLSPGPDRRNSALLFVGGLACIAPWFLFRLYYQVRVGSQAFSFQPHTDVPLQVLQNILSLTNFNVIVFFFPFLVILYGWPGRQLLHLLLPLAAYLLFFVAIYLFAGYYDWFIGGAVFHRNILTLFPALCAVTAVLLEPFLKTP